MVAARATLLWAGLFSTVSAGGQEPAARPNFTGSWKSVPGPKGGNVFSRIIDQSPARLQVLINTGVVTKIDCDLERRECTETVRSDGPQGRAAGKSPKKTVEWQGDTLVFSTLVGGVFPTHETWRLSPDGKTLSISVKVYQPTPQGEKEIDAGVGVWKKQE